MHNASSWPPTRKLSSLADGCAINFFPSHDIEFQWNYSSSFLLCSFAFIASSMLSPRRLMAVIVAAILAPFKFLLQIGLRIFWSGLNNRNVVTLPINFFVNFSPVFTWLLIFKNAGLIPTSIRPEIHVALAYHLDTFMFDIIDSPFGSILTVILTIIGSWLIYLRWYAPMSHHYAKIPASESDFELSSLEASEDEGNKVFGDTSMAPFDFQDHPSIPTLDLIPSLPDVSENATAINAKISQHFENTHSYKPYNSWAWAPPALLAASWFLLNIDHWFSRPITVPKDVVSWLSYVIGHFCVPLFTAIWLYVFHAPGALKLFSFALGAQNIAGVITHLLFPNAPPWFIILNGENGEATYETEGYAAGLTRSPFGTGAHVVTQGFHKSPIVFGALPSLHSAMAVMCFFFVCYYSRWTVSKLALFGFVFLQWWATIYLDHHWRLDLFAGLIYATVLFTVFYRWRMGRVDEEFAKARLRYDFVHGSTMGMRVFRNTKLQNFFDPLS